MAYSVHLYCAANDESTLARDLLRSPEIAGARVPVNIIRGASSAGVAYHKAITDADADVLVFAHQDVYFPEGWFRQVGPICERLTAIDPFWAAAGLFGVIHGGRFTGHLWDSGLGRVCGSPFDIPQEVVSLDEVVLIVRRAACISFDPALPSFHLYGTDLVLESRKLGKKSYVIDMPVIHNSKPVSRLDAGYVSAYHFMVRKWKDILPWPTVILPLTQNPLPLLCRRMRLRYKALFRRSTLHPVLERPDIKALDLGFRVPRLAERSPSTETAL